MIIIKDIPTLKAHLQKGLFYHNDIIPFLSVVRNELEERSIKEEIKFLNFFCNWSLHPKLNSSELIVDIMQLLVENLIKYDTEGSDSIRMFNNSIIDSFKSDLIKFFKLVNINYQFIENDEVFMAIFCYMLSVIHERPLVLSLCKPIYKKEAQKLKVKKLTQTASSLFQKDCSIKSLKLKVDQESRLSWVIDSTVFVYIEIPVLYKGKRLTLLNKK